MRALRIVSRGVVVLALLVALGLGAAAWVLGTESGTAWLVERALGRAGSYVTVGGRVSGTLIDTLVLRDVVLRLPGHEIATARVSVTPDLGRLIGGTLLLREVDVATVDYRQTPVEAPAETGGAVELPVDIVVERIAIAGVNVNVDDSVQQIGPTEAAVSYRGQALEIENLSASAAGFTVAGRVGSVLADPLELDVSLEWSGRYAERDLAGSLSASGTWPAVDVHHELAAPFGVVTDGTIEVGDELGFELDNEWSDAALDELEGVRSPAGTLSLSGTLEQFSFRGDGRITYDGPDAESRDAELEVTGERDGDTVRVAPVVLSAALGRIEAAGSFDLAALTFDLDVAAESLDPASELPDWPANLDADGRLSGGLEPELEIAFDEFTLAGELRGHPLAAAGALSYSASAGLTVREVSVGSGSSRVSIDGRFGERVDARVDARIDDFARWLPELEGALVADVSLQGSIDSPRVSGRVAATSIAYEEFAAELVSFEGDVGTALDSRVDAVIEARALRRGTVETDSITIELAGTARDHRIALDAAAPQWRATSAAGGRIDGRMWQGSISALEIAQDALGAWRLGDRVELELGPGNWRVSTACLRQGGASLCGSLTLTGAPEDALSLRATDFDVRTLAPLLPADLDVQGVYELEASLTDLSGTPTGGVSLAGGPTTVSVALSENESVETVIDSVAVDVGLSDWAMEIDAGFSGRQTGEATLSMDVDDIRAESSPVEGRIGVRWEDLALLSLLSPDVGQVGGSVGVDLMLGGTLDEPTLEGAAELAGGTVSVPAWGTDLEAVEATATSRDGRTLDVNATGRAGDGTLTLEGTTRLDPSAGWPTRALVRGEDVRAVQLPEAEILVSPNLNVLVSGTSIQVAGTVHVPRADLEIEQLPQQAVTPSADAVVHGRAEAREAAPRTLDVTADMTLTLGDDVRYEGSGLMADLSGDLRLRYRSGESENATGTLILDGEYTAYGQTLELEGGRLIFTGPIDNPTLDVRAVRSLDEVTVGVQLSGSLQSPQSSIFSMPRMAEADALSYLLFGRPLESAGEGADPAALENAAVSLGLRQALPAVERLGETLGLDELTVASSQANSGALMAGKQLSPKLYVRYSYGLFNSIGGLLLRFKVNDRLSLETRSGDRKSMDFLYTVEKE